MVKRLLAFVLTAAMIVETPATAYAAEQTPISEGGGVEIVQDLTEEGDEPDTSAQDGTEIGDTGDGISDEDANDPSTDTDTGVEDPDAADETPAAEETEETGNAADGDAADDMEGDAASGIVAVYTDEDGEVDPPSAIAKNVKLVSGDSNMGAAAYSFKDMFTVVAGDGVNTDEATLADSYTLTMTLNGTELKYAPNEADSDITLVKDESDASASYKKELCSSDFYYDGDESKTPLQLRPNTDYTLGYTLTWASEDETVEPSKGTITFKTAEAKILWSMDSETVAVGEKLPVTVTLDSAETADSVVLSAYWKISDSDDTAYSKLPDAVAFTRDKSYTQTFNVDTAAMKQEGKYTLALGVDGADGAVVAYDTHSFSLTAANGDEGDDPKEDDREIKGISVEPTFRSATINYTLSGSLSHKDFVVCYYKAKDAQSWTKVDYWFGDEYEPFTITGLSSETEYEYKIGFGNADNTPDDALVKSVQGGFKTTADNRKVTATVEPKVTRATIDYTLSGGYTNEDLLYCFYKAKGTDSWTPTYYNYNQYYRYGYESFELDGLNPETEYEYKVGFASGHIETPDKLEGACAEGSFTTQADQRKLSDAKAEVVESSEGPRIKLNAYFSGNIENAYTYIHYFYREQAAAAWTHDYNYIWTNSIKQYCPQYIDDIKWGKTYEYAIAISDDYSLSNPDAVTKEGWKVTGTVEVPAVTVPTSIKLSQTELYLNLNEADEDGYVYQNIKAEIAPADANKVLICESSNTGIVNAGYYNGSIEVYAWGAGTAKITVKSPYSETVSAEINVEVGNYAVYVKNGNDVEEISSVAYTKATESIEEYLLYKEESGEMIPVSDYAVTSENEDIVTWNAEKRKLVTGKSVGSADLVFTDGKFKARLTVYTYVAAKSLAITGLTSDSGYDAIEKDGVYTIAYNDSYEAVVKFSPSPYDIIRLPEITWSSSNESVATVYDGSITPVGVGEATITAVANEKDILAPATIKIKVVDLPQNPAATPIYVLANTVTKLSDVTCPDGWEWKVPDTPIVTNGVKDSYAYQFDAVYTKGDKYPAETEISVYIAQVTGMSVYGNSDAVLEVANSTDAESDSLTLTVSTNYHGSFNSLTKANGYEDYQIEIPAVNGLSIEPVKLQSPSSYYDENGLSRYGSQQFTIKAQKAGKYTLNLAISVKDGNGKKQLAKASYKLTAVDAALAESVEIRLTEEAKKNPSIKLDEDDNGRLYIDWTPTNEMGASAAESVKDFDVEAILKDWKDYKDPTKTVTSKSLEDTKLTWKVSDAKVATVKADSKNSQKATVTVKGEGHTILTATAKDAAGHSAQLKIEIRNHAPRVSSSKVTVNTAFDYDSAYGRENAINAAGSVEIIPVYGEGISDVQLYEGDALSSSFKIYRSGSVYVIGSKSAEVSTGNRRAELRVTTYENKTYKYPIQVTVVNKRAKITAKSFNTFNLFYTDAYPVMSFKVSGAYNGISSVKWTDKSPGAGNGFSTNWEYYGDTDGAATEHWYGEQQNISLNGKKLSDANIVKGEFTVKLNGYRDTYKVPATIKWNYKKPAIVTYRNGKAAASTTIEPSIGVCNSWFYLYDKTNKRYVDYNDDADDYAGQEEYTDLICNNKNVVMTPYPREYDEEYDYYYDSNVVYQYTGTKTSGSEKIEFKLSSNVWREDITVRHTVKLASPTAALTASQIVINTKKPATNSTSIYLKNSGYYAKLSDIKVEGKDSKSAKLLDDDLLEIINYNGSNTVYVKQNDAKLMGKEIKAGTYSYKLTPNYTDNSGESRALNTLVLKVKVVNNDITVKTKVKNTLDLVKGDDWCNYMEITPTFSNIGTGYRVNSVKLTGEYSKYFDLTYFSTNGYRRLMISSEGVGKLKAGQSYKLTLEYTVSMPSGDTFTVKAAPITVKPKQMAPKVKVYNNNQTIYAGADNVSRTYGLETDVYKYKSNGYTYTSRPYKIISVSGSLDCNKDGSADIKVSNYSSGYSSCSLKVEIIDRDGVLTATGAKGKTYSIPVTVTLTGRDGISRDVKTTIKVTVKR